MGQPRFDVPEINPYRARLFKFILGLAAFYNLAFGAWAGLWPRSFFDLFEIAPPRYPAIWQCLGMVIGLYGLAYGYATLHLNLARPFVAIGLLGKILGPIGWVLTVRSGEWPLQTFSLIVFNDIVWWLPFSLFLLEGTWIGERVRAAAPYACAAINAIAGSALLLTLRGGTELVPDIAKRTAYIAQNPVLWRAGWGLWMAAALSLLGFYAWWGARLQGPGWGIAAFAVAAIGLTCDLLAESLYIGWFPEHLATLQRPATILSSGAANGLYTVGGVILTLGTRSLWGRFLVWTWAIWLSGFSLSLSALAGSVTGMAASGAALLILFCPWAAIMGWKLK